MHGRSPTLEVPVCTVSQLVYEAGPRHNMRYVLILKIKTKQRMKVSRKGVYTTVGRFQAGGR